MYWSQYGLKPSQARKSPVFVMIEDSDYKEYIFLTCRVDE